jgi:hypothetical protein
MAQAAVLKSGTEYRSQFKTVRNASLASERADKPGLALGPEKTSSIIGLPWPQQQSLPEARWSKNVWAPSGVRGSTHFRQSSSAIGAVPQKAYHVHESNTKASVAGTVRYLQAPWLSGELAYGAGIDSRPVSSVSTFSLASDRQADILAGGEARLGERLGSSAAWTGARSLRSAPIPSAPQPYLTTTNASFTHRPMADSQQQRLRASVTSSLVPARTLDSAPVRCPTAPLDGGAALHGTRFLGVRDSDGGRRLIEVDTTGRPAAISPWKVPAVPIEPPAPPTPGAFVSSQPATHLMDVHRTTAASAGFDPAATPLPRSPWPKDAMVSVKHRRPFAMGYENGKPAMHEHIIRQTQKQALAEAAAEA